MTSEQTTSTPCRSSAHTTDGIAISAENVSKNFQGNAVLKNISFKVQPGEIFAIMGPSGSGKTVLLQHIIGLILPDSGEIQIAGYSTRRGDLLNHVRMTMVFQNGGLLNSLSVEENVGLYLQEHRIKKRGEIKKIVSAELERLHLSTVDANKYPYELSGGMRKRVAIARAIVMEPKVVLYDEPTSELDPAVATTVVEEIRHVHELQKQTTVLVTHDRDLAYEVANHIAIIVQGEILAIGTPDEIRSIPNKPDADPRLKKFLTIQYNNQI